MNKLIVYPNCSKGGVTSVIRARANSEPQNHFTVVFFNDRGGRHAFEDIKNITVRIIPLNRAESFFTYLVDLVDFEEISVLSHPESANILSSNKDCPVIYEFHSSNLAVIEAEVRKLNLDQLAAIYVPSQEMAAQIKRILPARIRYRIRVMPNKVDTTIFNTEGGFGPFKAIAESNQDTTYLLWVGRFDVSKGIRHFVRMLALLPSHYKALIVVSFENDPNRISAFIGECDAMGVSDRVRIFMDLPQETISQLYRAVAKSTGWLVSTSLMESFGYSVEEALHCGLRATAYELPVWDRLKGIPNFSQVEAGNVRALANFIESTH